MRSSLATSLVVHAALAGAAAVAWRAHVAAPAPRPCVLAVAPAEELATPAPPFAPPDAPDAPALVVEDAAFPEPEPVPGVPLAEAAPAVPHTSGPPPVARLPRPLRARPAAPAPVAVVRPAPPPRAPPVARPRGPTRGPVLLASDARAPEYPREARRRGHEGRVVLRVYVAANGRVGRVDVVSSSGHRLLDDAAVGAARTWRFRPALRDGRAVAATYRRSIRFRLERS